MTRSLPRARSRRLVCASPCTMMTMIALAYKRRSEPAPRETAAAEARLSVKERERDSRVGRSSVGDVDAATRPISSLGSILRESVRGDARGLKR